MSAFTPPQELFREIREIDQMILDLIATPSTVTWHWPSYYLLYVDIDSMGWLLRSAASVVVEPFVGNDKGVPIAECVAQANESFSQLERRLTSIVGRLWQLSRNFATTIDDKALNYRMRCHFHPKSEWFQAFSDQYSAGKIAPDGRTLTRTVLLVDVQPMDRMPDLLEKGLVQHHAFDLTAEPVSNTLADAALAAVTEHDKVCGAMMNFFLQHCTVQDLAHPSSV